MALERRDGHSRLGQRLGAARSRAHDAPITSCQIVTSAIGPLYPYGRGSTWSRLDAVAEVRIDYRYTSRRCPTSTTSTTMTRSLMWHRIR
jgi:hypothetical protein